MEQQTLTFDETINGWTSFFSFIPEFMAGLNGRFFSFRDGELWLHNSKNVPRNNFYGEQFISKVSVVLNENPSTEKMFKNIMLEGTKPWKVDLKSNLSKGVIFREEFEKKKSRWFAYTRRNEDTQDLTSFAANGIGNITDIVGNTLFFRSVSDMICVGDKLTQVQSGEQVDIGIINMIDRATGEIHFQEYDNAPALNEFCYATKHARVEGGEIRGYYLRVDLESDDTDFAELFAVNSNTAESYV